MLRLRSATASTALSNSFDFAQQQLRLRSATASTASATLSNQVSRKKGAERSRSTYVMFH